MKVCLICGEIFAWGKYGGFGRATRTIGRELVRRGIEVCAVVPRRRDQKPVERLDGITVLGFPIWNPLASAALYYSCDADLYHSEEPSLGTLLAMKVRPRRKHVVTFRDTRDAEDWKTEIALPSRSRMQTRLTRWYESSLPVKQAVRRADALYCAAHCVGDKAARVFGLPCPPPLLPTPVAVPENARKDERPTVCCISRLDRRKRPELLLRLIPEFPDVRFIIAGPSQDPQWFDSLLKPYAQLPNLEYRGFVDQFESSGVSDTFARSWILINTAAREGLPNSYLEAAAHGCAILSRTDPDGFASNFGYHASDDDFASGLRQLLQDDCWRRRGQDGLAYVRRHYEQNRAIDLHIEAYRRVLGESFRI